VKQRTKLRARLLFLSTHTRRAFVKKTTKTSGAQKEIIWKVSSKRTREKTRKIKTEKQKKKEKNKKLH
jgi:hypothetical protein